MVGETGKGTHRSSPCLPSTPSCLNGLHSTFANRIVWSNADPRKRVTPVVPSIAGYDQNFSTVTDYLVQLRNAGKVELTTVEELILRHDIKTVADWDPADCTVTVGPGRAFIHSITSPVLRLVVPGEDPHHSPCTVQRFAGNLAGRKGQRLHTAFSVRILETVRECV